MSLNTKYCVIFETIVMLAKKFYVMPIYWLKHDFLSFSYSISICILHKELPKVIKKSREKERKDKENHIIIV